MRPTVLVLLALALLTVPACVASEEDPPAPTCEGIPLTCAGFATRTGCSQQLGCRASGDECTGTARSCDLFYSQVYCNDQPGCYWSSLSNRCTGSASPCSIQSQSSCFQITGCLWEPLRCGGVAEACEAFTTEDACGYQQGCDWQTAE